MDKHTSQLQPMVGTPELVPEPSTVMWSHRPGSTTITRLVMIEATHDHYTAREVWEAIASRFKRKPKEQTRQAVLAPQAPQAGTPQTEVQRPV